VEGGWVTKKRGYRRVRGGKGLGGGGEDLNMVGEETKRGQTTGTPKKKSEKGGEKKESGTGSVLEMGRRNGPRRVRGGTGKQLNKGMHKMIRVGKGNDGGIKKRQRETLSGAPP